MVKQFDSARASYLGDVDALKQGIAKASFGIETKRSLNALANAPQKMNEASSRISYAASLQEKAGEVYSTVLSQADNFVQGLATREKKASAWLAIYGFDSEIIGETRLEGIDSLQGLAELVLGEKYVYQWKDQAGIQLLQENWSKAKAYYGNGSFDSAKKFAEESKKYALRVYSAGLAEQEQAVNTDLLITGAVLLIIALIALYALRNRKKLASLVSMQSQEEAQLDEWGK